ncbi:MAG TPA: dTDP-4-dehydrorhamnose reductase [Candidatus Binatia bacterium]|nr:dTDP-4-dehydrorhamnose reductase [Candidatus Binatia bacterium]
MRIVVLGAAGQLGRELVVLLPRDETVALARHDLDVCDRDAVARRLAALAPDVVVNLAAENRVDAAEDNPTEAVAVNALAAGWIAAACRDTGAFLVHTSTDYVFDGRAREPYREDDRPNPEGAYARSKLAGELLARTLARRHAVVRLAGLYAAGGARRKGGCFVDRVIERARRGETLRIVSDQVTAPTWARDAAAALARLLPRWAVGDAPAGVYHVSNAGACSWYDFARAALELAHVDAAIEPITSATLNAPAPRPAYSVLANGRLTAIGEPPLRPWRDALAAYLSGR